MTKTHSAPAEQSPTVTEILAPLAIAQIDALSDQAVADLMGATAGEIATEPAWAWREAAKVATDDYVDRLAADVHSGRATAIAAD